jgi:predicted DsbA family dithiol-disulfide isomerase
MVRLTYYTDPACPWSWTAEPALRRLQIQFGEDARITYVMAGMARELNDPLQLLDASLEAAAWSGMPVDPRIWRERPPKSTYPACQAVKAAAEQELDGPYLRVLREAIMRARSSGSTWRASRSTCASDAIVEAFGADLERARGRELPTFVLEDAGHEASGQVAPDALAPGRERPVAEVLARFGSVAAAEVAACCDLPLARAQAELWQLAGQWRARGAGSGSCGLPISRLYWRS